jgi:hypothetical protein
MAWSGVYSEEVTLERSLVLVGCLLLLGGVLIGSSLFMTVEELDKTIRCSRDNVLLNCRVFSNSLILN